MNFLQDKEFLKQINQYRVRIYKAMIRLLDFETETPLAILQGKVVSGNLSIAANSSVRRTCSLTLLADDDTIKIADINNIIAIDKKISLDVGFDNPLYNNAEYKKYGKTLWFKQGVFFITSASSSFSTSGATISVSLVDKMGKLNGTCGGILPASTSFHDRITVIDTEGNTKTTYPLIKDIIKECVHHFGEEHYSRIVVENIDDVGRIQINYNGDTPIRISDPNESDSIKGRSFIIDEKETEGFSEVYYQGDPIGYIETDLTFPGELIVNAGTPITGVLDTIQKTLGNFEYFYDVDGNFHFQRIKDFQATGDVPLNWQISDADDKALWQSYLPRYNNTTRIDEFIDTSLVTQISYSPKYDNIKNDFVVWGTLNDNGKVNNNVAVRYHLAIDRRPVEIPEPKPGSPEIYTVGKDYSLCYKTIFRVTDHETGLVLRYQTSSVANDGEDVDVFCRPLSYYNNDLDGSRLAQVNIPNFNWREELYRQALLGVGSSTRSSYYDEELLAEWRDVFNPNNNDFRTEWNRHHTAFGDWTGYNPDIKLAPHKIRYWLDIIDSSSSIGQFAVQRIGRRTKVSENNNIKSVFPTEVPDIVFCINDGSNLEERAQYYIDIGQDFSFITPDQENLFKKVNSYGTCYDDVRAMLMTDLLYNNSINLTCIPILYLDVNEILHLNFPKLGIVGDYVIKNIGWALGGSSNTMSLTLNEANIVV